MSPRDIAEGELTNANGTLNLVHYVAWLVKAAGNHVRRRLWRSKWDRKAAETYSGTWRRHEKRS